MANDLIQEAVVKIIVQIIGGSVTGIIVLIAQSRLAKPKIITIPPTALRGSVQYPEMKKIDEDEHMTYREAVFVSLFLIPLAMIFTSFLIFYDWSTVAIEPKSFIFDLIKFAGFTFLGIFIVIIGRIKYLRHAPIDKEKELEKTEENKLTKLLQVHFGKLMKRGPGDTGHAYSLTYVSWDIISNDENVRKRTIAWQYLFLSLVDKFKMEADKLSKDLEKGIGFPDAFDNFQVLLSTLKDIKEKFYEMINEVKPNKDFTQDSSFQKIYKKLHKEYNEYMNNLRMFSIVCEAQLELKLDKNSIEPLKDLNQL